MQRVIADPFGVAYRERYVGKLPKELGFSHMSVRPRHPAQDAWIVEEFKRISAHARRPPRRSAEGQARRGVVWL
ncbi:helix-turn-helix domain-containing protein [Mesorhizobium sp. ORM8.1]